MSARKITRLVLFVLFVGTLPGWSQVPVWWSSPWTLRRVPETALGGVHIDSTDGEFEIQTLIEALGTPNREAHDPKKELFHYYWAVGGLDFEVAVIRHGPLGTRIQSIDVRGRRSNGKIGLTGNGLSIGSTANDAARIYSFALRYQTNWLSNRLPWLNGYSTAFVSTDEFSPLLRIEFDQGVVVHMNLTNRCPYVCF